MAGRPRKEFDKKTFVDLIGLGCTQEEICWFFRDNAGKPANIDTLSRWCKREFKLNFQDFKKTNGGIMRDIQLRKNQLELSKKNAAMAIFLGKNYLGQKDSFEQVVTEVEDLTPLAEMLKDDDEPEPQPEPKQEPQQEQQTDGEESTD